MYEPNMDPKTWIDDYAMAMAIVNASDLICARYLPLMLGGSARTWINNLPRDSIDSWKDMTRAFVKNFEGTCNRPASIEDLQRCVQKEGESTRKYLGRCSDLWNSSSGISVDTAILIFRENCKFDPLVQKLKRMKTPVASISQLMEVAGRYAGSDPTKDDSDGEHDARKEGRH